MAKYPILTDEMFNDMMSSDAGIREARYAIGYGRWVNGESVTDGHYVSWPDYRSKWEISDEQRELALQRFEERKAETMEYCSQRGVLTWHRMGMDYEPTIEEGVDVENAHVKFSYGNRKTGNLVPSVSLIPIADCCSNCAFCAKGCYAVRNICCYDDTRKMLANNSAILRSDPGKYWREVEGEVMRNRWFRFHVSGDIVDYSYFVNMVGIAVRNPHCEILAFTKNFSVVNEFIDYAGGTEKMPKNLHIIFSEWRGLDVPNPHNLPTSRPVWKGDHIEGIWCGGNCSVCAVNDCGCWTLKKGEKILFEAH